MTTDYGGFMSVPALAPTLAPPERIVFDYRLSNEFFNRHRKESTEFGDYPNPNVKV